MKKLRCIFSFLNKKGVFALGLALGIVFSLFFSNFVFGAEVVIPSDAKLYVSYDTHHSGVHKDYLDRDYYISSECDLYSNIACYKSSTRTDEDNYVLDTYTFYFSNAYARWSEQYKNMDSGDRYANVEGSFSVFNHEGNRGSFSFYCYVFSSESECKSFLEGNIDASSALNYGDIQNNNKIYDSSIPSLDYLKYDTITDKGFIANFGFNDADTFSNYADVNNSDFMYDIQVVHFYSEYEGLSRFEQLMSKGVSNVNKWVSNNFGSGNPIEDEIALSKVQAVYDSNGLIKTDLCPTVESYNKNNNNGLLLFTVTVNGSDVLSITNSVTYKVEPYANLVYVGSQTCVTPYVIRDGQKYYGNSIYYQGFNTTGYQEYYGTPSNIIGTFDELGDYTTINSNNASSIGNSTVSLTSDNLLDYIHTGFGLSGTGGYIALMQAFFLGIPAWFWVLVSTALATNLILLSVKVIRGM